MTDLSPYLETIMKSDPEGTPDPGTNPGGGGIVTPGYGQSATGPIGSEQETYIPPGGVETPNAPDLGGNTGQTGYAGGQIQFPNITDIGGKPFPDNAILPGMVPPVNSDLRDGFLRWLQSQIGQGAPAYPGQLSPDVNNTRLPEVWNSWQPWDGGMGYLAQQLGAGVGQNSPILQQLSQYGGTGGPGHQAMSNMVNYGTPSSIGQFLSNMAQFGVASEGSGRPLANLAAGYAAGPAAFLAPFLTGGAGNSNYAAPNIPARTPKIGV